MSMKPTKQLALYLLAGFLAAGTGTAPDTIPDFELKNLDGEMVSFSEVKGEHLTVIDFWATWCAPCLQSIPALVELAAQFEGQGVTFVGINVDSPRNLAKVKPFARSMGISYPVLLDVNSEIMAELNVTAMPTLLVVDAANEVVWFHEGYRPGDDQYIREELERLLAGETGTP